MSDDDNSEELQQLLDHGGMPANFTHCVRVYEAMHNEIDMDGNWKGSLTKLLPTLNLPAPYYTQITRELKRMGCIVQLRRGGGGAHSVWALHQEPTKDLWHNGAPGTAQAKEIATLATKSPQKQLEQAVRMLHERLTAVEGEVRLLKAKELQGLTDPWVTDEGGDDGSSIVE